jgi:hypothetical protein
MARSESATVDIKIRMKEPLRADIEDSANRRGISMNAEMVDRLTQSYRNDQSIISALDFAYGRETAGVMMLLHEVIKHTVRDAALIVADRGRGVDWLSQPYAFDQVVRGVNHALNGLKPSGDPSPPEWDLGPLLAAKVGEFMAATVLDAVIDPENAHLGLSSWAKHVSERLGSKLVERLRGSDPGKTIDDIFTGGTK